MTWLKQILGVAAVLGTIAVASLPVSSAGGREHMERNIREAKTPADHQAIVAFYEQEAQTARELSANHLAMRDSYATIPVLQEKGRAVDHCNAIARKYQEMAQDYAGLAEMHRRLAAQAKEGP